VAQAHHTAVPIVALDYRNRVQPTGPGLDGVHPSLEDAGRKLRLTVDAGSDAIVLGYLGEPFLRFTRAGVAANLRSATAQGLRLVAKGDVSSSAGQAVWHRVTPGHSFSWSDTRVWAPSSALGGRKLVAWAVPVVVDGHGTQVTGELTRSPRPAIWPGAVLVALCVVLAIVATRRKRWLWPGAVGLAAAAGIATVANMSGFAFGGLPVSADRWVLFATEVVLTLAALGLLTRRGARLLAVAALAAFAVLQSLSELSVFRHGVVVSALPATAVRVAAAIGLGAGLGAAGLVFLAPSSSTLRHTRGGRRGRPRRNLRKGLSTRPLRKEQA
jgi:hypothetical protein